MFKIAAVISAVLLWSCSGEVNQTKLQEAREYLAYLDTEVCKLLMEKSMAEFNYYTNITDENSEKMSIEDSRPKLFNAKYKEFDWECFNEPDLLRQAERYGLLDKQPSQELLDSMGDITSQMLDAVSSEINYCSYKNRSICGEEGFSAYIDAFYNSNDTNEILFYWKTTHDSVNQAVRPLYESYINISIITAKAEGYENKADQFMSAYESPPVEQFEGVIMDLWKQVEPLLKQYHAFKRNRLQKHFGEQTVPKNGPIPFHLFELDIRKGFKPYPGKPSTDIAKALEKQNYTVMQVVRQVEDYYESLGLGVLPKSFYEQSMFVKPEDRHVNCDATSFDFYNKIDFRISSCILLTYASISDLVHEMGHVYNFMGYKDQPCCYRDTPSPGLDEGVANTMPLSFMSYKHLTKLGLLNDSDANDPEIIINSLFVKAESLLPNVAATILLDVLRWNIFRGNICPENINEEYWNYRLQFQGTMPPEERSEEYLDIAENIQVVDDSQIISYFLSYIISFQFHEALCIAAKQYDPQDPTANPLYNCDLYGNKDAGTLLKKLYVLGASKSWPASMEAVTGQPNIDAGPLLRYFQPLYDWLVEENEKNGEYIGWV